MRTSCAQPPVLPEPWLDRTVNGRLLPVQPSAQRLPCTATAVLPFRHRAGDRGADLVSSQLARANETGGKVAREATDQETDLS